MERRLKKHRFHRICLTALRTVFGPLIKRIYAFRTDRAAAIEGPFLVVANHVTAADPVLLCLSFRSQMYFVASEHLMQKGLPSALLRFFFDPIVRRKGDSAVTAVREMLACLKNGQNVCVFPEGTCSFDGKNSPMLPTIGKLARTSGATLVTYRFEGGYFTLPRWGRGIRRGFYEGHIVNRYAPETLRAMSNEAVNACIAAELSEDAYARQEQVRAVYKSRRRAEYLESAFFLCPACGRIGTVETQGETIRCRCGMTGTLDASYRLSGLPVKTLVEWDALETSALAEMARDPDFALQDENAVLVETDEKHRRIPKAAGPLCMTRSSISVGPYAVSLDAITDMELVRRNLLVFSANGGHYQIGGKPALCTRKYMLLYRLWKGAEQI
jgi:1-acyl-sn-glycerol-3-phosphate acyltransferase